MNSYRLTILTPTYNRSDNLKKLYDSLVSQSKHGFQWLIVDDGSTDGTSDVVGAFDTVLFPIEYYFKSNGGKHTALNYSHEYIRGEWVCIVDSDDWLTPDAVEKIFNRIDEFASCNNVKVLSFLRGRNEVDILSDPYPEDVVISNHIDFRINDHRRGDCCEVIKADALKEYPFPEYQGERFLGEGYLWNHVGFKYDTVYIPEVIYVCDYLEGGLTKQGRKLRIACPLGGMANANSFFIVNGDRAVNNKTLRKEAMLFICYGLFAHMRRKEIIANCLRPDLIKRNYLLGMLLFLYWRIKYSR